MSSLILGFGNPLRSDDAAGYQAAVVLESELSGSNTSILAVSQLTPELADYISRVSHVLFLDASHDGVPGEIRIEGILRDPYFQPGALTHTVTPSSLLELAMRYFHAEPDAWLLTLTGQNFALGEEYSPPVAAAWPNYLERIRLWARSY